MRVHEKSYHVISHLVTYVVLILVLSSCVTDRNRNDNPVNYIHFSICDTLFNTITNSRYRFSSEEFLDIENMSTKLTGLGHTLINDWKIKSNSSDLIEFIIVGENNITNRLYKSDSRCSFQSTHETNLDGIIFFNFDQATVYDAEFTFYHNKQGNEPYRDSFSIIVDSIPIIDFNNENIKYHLLSVPPGKKYSIDVETDGHFQFLLRNHIQPETFLLSSGFSGNYGTDNTNDTNYVNYAFFMMPVLQ